MTDIHFDHPKLRSETLTKVTKVAKLDFTLLVHQTLSFINFAGELKYVSSPGDLKKRYGTVIAYRQCTQLEYVRGVKRQRLVHVTLNRNVN